MNSKKSKTSNKQLLLPAFPQNPKEEEQLIEQNEIEQIFLIFTESSSQIHSSLFTLLNNFNFKVTKSFVLELLQMIKKLEDKHKKEIIKLQ
jgi:mevalonate pyrophosphate decarboxylase